VRIIHPEGTVSNIPDDVKSTSGNDALLEDKLATDIAASAVKQWNGDRQAEVSNARQLAKSDTQDAMAEEVYLAVMQYLHTVPRGVREAVITKFQQLPSPKRLITL
jgi:hypothetical protein